MDGLQFVLNRATKLNSDQFQYFIIAINYIIIIIIIIRLLLWSAEMPPN